LHHVAWYCYRHWPRYPYGNHGLFGGACDVTPRLGWGYSCLCVLPPSRLQKSISKNPSNQCHLDAAQYATGTLETPGSGRRDVAPLRLTFSFDKKPYCLGRLWSAGQRPQQAGFWLEWGREAIACDWHC
jgi:hypothetical protein